MGIFNGRKLAFTLIASVLAIGLLELGSFLILSAGQGQWMSFSRIDALRLERAEPDVAVEKEGAINPYMADTVIHPYLGFVRDASTFPLKEQHNSRAQDYGFIQNRHDLFQQPSDEDVVLAVFGGSVARGVVVHGDALNRALKKSPRFKGRNVKVLSLAAGAYKQPQQLMVMNYFLALGAHFDIAINLDGLNDLVAPAVRLISDKTFPFFPSHWHSRVADLSLNDRRLVGKLTFLRESRRDQADSFSRKPWRFSMTTSLVWKGLDNIKTNRILQAEQELEAQVSEGDYQARGPIRTYENAEEMYLDIVGMWSRTSHQMYLLCKGKGIEYHHILQPNQYLSGSKPMSAEEKKVAWWSEHPYRSHVEEGYPRMIRAGLELREEGVAFHDFTRIFENNHEILYRDNCCHFNKEGNRLLAEAIVEALEGSR